MLPHVCTKDQQSKNSKISQKLELSSVSPVDVAQLNHQTLVILFVYLNLPFIHLFIISSVPSPAWFSIAKLNLAASFSNLWPTVFWVTISAAFQLSLVVWLIILRIKNSCNLIDFSTLTLQASSKLFTSLIFCGYDLAYISICLSVYLYPIPLSILVYI